MAEWLKAAVLKTVERKFRGFESYFLRHDFMTGEMTELADGARLLSECGGHTPPRVRIPLSPPDIQPVLWNGFFCAFPRCIYVVGRSRYAADKPGIHGHPCD